MGKKNQNRQDASNVASQDAPSQEQAPQPKGEERHKLYFAARQEAIRRFISGEALQEAGVEFPISDAAALRIAYEAMLSACKREIGLSDAPAASGKLSAFEKRKALLAKSA